MKIAVLLFAAAKELAGRDTIQIELNADATVKDLRERLGIEFPQLQDLLLRSAIAVNHQYASADTRLDENSEVGLIPPVSGG